MWKPTVGKVVGFIRSSSLYGEYYQVVCDSHTGKRFTIDTILAERIGREVGNIVFCNGEKCVWYPDEESAFKRLNEVLKENNER